MRSYLNLCSSTTRRPVPPKEIGSNPNVCLAQTMGIGVAVVLEEGCVHAFKDGVSSKAWNCVPQEVDVLKSKANTLTDNDEDNSRHKGIRPSAEHMEKRRVKRSEVQSR